jgi:hypothetical protein
MIPKDVTRGCVYPFKYSSPLVGSLKIIMTLFSKSFCATNATGTKNNMPTTNILNALFKFYIYPDLFIVPLDLGAIKKMSTNFTNYHELSRIKKINYKKSVPPSYNEASGQTMNLLLTLPL